MKGLYKTKFKTILFWKWALEGTSSVILCVSVGDIFKTLMAADIQCVDPFFAGSEIVRTCSVLRARSEHAHYWRQL